MTDYHDMTAAERFERLDALATDFFDTARWKTAFARRYGLTPQGVDEWRSGRRGMPVWPLVAVSDALAGKRLDQLTAAIAEAMKGMD